MVEVNYEENRTVKVIIISGRIKHHPGEQVATVHEVEYDMTNNENKIITDLKERKEIPAELQDVLTSFKKNIIGKNLLDILPMGKNEIYIWGGE